MNIEVKLTSWTNGRFATVCQARLYEPIEWVKQEVANEIDGNTLLENCVISGSFDGSTLRAIRITAKSAAGDVHYELADNDNLVAWGCADMGEPCEGMRSYCCGLDTVIIATSHLSYGWEMADIAAKLAAVMNWD